MGVRALLRGQRVYFDTMIFVYLVEGFAKLQRELEDIRQSVLHRECEIFTSELTLCEVLVSPFRNNDSALAATYREFIEDSGAFTLLPMHRELWIRASLYRAQFGLKTPDALHVASAIAPGCEIFMTNDRGISAPKNLRVVNLQQASVRE